jgi:hypothetical protein
MRAACLISLLLAIALGSVAVGSYLDDSSKRDRAFGQVLVLRADSPLRSSYLELIATLDGNKRNDETLGLLAALLLIGSLAMLSRQAELSHDTRRHGHKH